MLISIAILSLTTLLPIEPAKRTFVTAVAAQEEVPELNLALDLSGLPGLLRQAIPEGRKGGQLKAIWTGELDGRQLQLDVWRLPYEFGSPREVIDLMAERAERPGEPFKFNRTYPLPGAFGYIPYGWMGIHVKHEGTKPVAHTLMLGGVLERGGYCLELSAQPALLDEQLAQVEKVLAQVTWSGAAFNPRWTDEEVQKRWLRDAPENARKKDNLQVVRTKNYMVLTNVGKSTAKKFGKQMDENYERIRKVYPFEDVEGQRLLPIFYFAMPEQYYDFCVRVLKWSQESAQRSKGVAWRDFYATYQESRTDPVHVHEGTHQIFANRLFLSGGGSWFQEGVAEYMSTGPNDLTPVGNLIKKSEHTALSKFMVVPSLLMSNSGSNKKTGDTSGTAYEQAAALIEFVAESKWGAGKLQEFTLAMGAVADGDLPAIELALQAVYGIDVKGFEAEFIKYWSNRKKQVDSKRSKKLRKLRG